MPPGNLSKSTGVDEIQLGRNVGQKDDFATTISKSCTKLGAPRESLVLLQEILVIMMKLPIKLNNWSGTPCLI